MLLGSVPTIAKRESTLSFGCPALGCGENWFDQTSHLWQAMGEGEATGTEPVVAGSFVAHPVYLLGHRTDISVGAFNL